YPLDAFLARRIGKRRLRALELGELAHDGLEQVLVEAGADLTRVLELAARDLGHAEDQSAETGARAAGGGVAGDHEVLPLAALELDPGLRAPRDVGRKIGRASCRERV